MISCLSGQIKHKNDKFIILDVNGVGYQVFISPLTLEAISQSEKATLFTKLFVKEDAMELYGFLTLEELEFFEQLLTVSSIGPRSALSIISVGKVEEIKKAIIHGDASILTKVSGIGQKTAERLILELKNKISIKTREGEKVDLENLGDSNAIDALVNLGYKRAEAREALHKVDTSITDVKDRVREALKMLGKK